MQFLQVCDLLHLEVVKCRWDRFVGQALVVVYEGHLDVVQGLVVQGGVEVLLVGVHSL